MARRWGVVRGMEAVAMGRRRLSGERRLSGGGVVVRGRGGAIGRSVYVIEWLKSRKVLS